MAPVAPILSALTRVLAPAMRAAPALGRVAPGAKTLGSAYKLLPGIAKGSPQIIKPIVQAAPKAKGGFNPLAMLAGGAGKGSTLKNVVGGATVISALPVIAGAGEWSQLSNIGSDKAGDLDDLGQSYRDGFNIVDNLRMRTNALLKGHVGEAILTGPSDATKEAVRGASQKQRAEDFRKTFASQIMANKNSMYGLNTKVNMTDNFVGRSDTMIQADLAADAEKAGQVGRILELDGGQELLAAINPNTDFQGLRGQATQLIKNNKKAEEQKIQAERERQEGRLDAAENRQREDNRSAQELQILMNDSALQRDERVRQQERDDRNYYSMLELKENRAQRQEQRIRDERQAQREMISLLMGGLSNLG